MNAHIGNKVMDQSSRSFGSNQRPMQVEKARRILRMKQYLSTQEAQKEYQSTMAAMPAAEATKFMEHLIKKA